MEAKKGILAAFVSLLMIGIVFGSMAYGNKGNDTNESDNILKKQTDVNKVLKPLTDLSKESLESKSSGLNKFPALKNAAEVTASGNILYVGGSGPNNYTKIQDAINGANDGDTVFVYDDSSPYYENIVVNKSITLIGEKKETTIIDGNGGGNDVVKITADGATIQEFGITHSGYNGVEIYYANNIVIFNCNIYSNDVDGIRLYSSNDIIFNCNISNNGNGIVGFVYSSSNDTIFNCNISNNDYGIVLWSSSNYKISHCNIYLNNNCGIYARYSSNNEIYNCNISNNDYGIKLYESSSNNITKNLIKDNSYGVYLYQDSNNNFIHRNNFINNSIQAYDKYNEWINTWNDEYPLGGNYWNDYNGSDNYKGINQDIPGEDGIGDIPYYIQGGNNRDRYPLMTRWEEQTMLDYMLILLPTNQIRIVEEGEMVNYTLTIKNVGKYNDSYNISVLANWTTLIYNINGTNEISSTPTIQPNSTFEFIVKVSVPIGNGEKDIALINVKSQNDSTVWANSTIISTITGPVYNVNKDKYYLAIQEAINDANEGDTIFVYNGTYYENVIVNKTINLIGENKNTTIIDGMGSGIGISVTADYVNISDFTIINTLSSPGIQIDSNYNNISNCNISTFIELDHATHNYVENNVAVTISLDYSLYNHIINNIIANIGVGYSNYNIISENTLNSGEITLLGSNHNNISHNTIRDSSDNYGAVYIHGNSDYNNISENSIYNVKYGIYMIVSWAGADNDYNKILNNLIECKNISYSYGIYIDYENDNNTISGNTIYNAIGYGIALFSWSDDAYISNNTIINCSNGGIYLHASARSYVIGNTIVGGKYGIALLSSPVTVFHNNLINTTTPAHDYYNNTWDNGYPSGGNYYSNFDEPSEGAWDNNSDGIADSPYKIPGGKSIDHYPLMYPYDPPYAVFEYTIENKTVTFDASHSGDYNGYIVSYEWDFGDGTNETGMIVNHTYAQGGYYDVTLVVTDDDGGKDSITKTIGIWAYKKPINLWVSSGETPSYYQVLLNITYNTSMKPDFSDLRFIRYNDNTTELDYWIEKKVDGSWCNVWLEIADNITTENKTLAWMYYGNPDASSASNGDETFLFFDDFNDGIYRDKWNIDENSDSIGTAYQFNGKLFLRTREINRTISLITKESFESLFDNNNGTVLEYDVWTRYNPPYPKGKDGSLRTYILNESNNKWIRGIYAGWSGNVKLEDNKDNSTILGRTSRRTNNIHAFVSLGCNISNTFMRWKEINDPGWIEDDFNDSIQTNMTGSIASVKIKLELHCGGSKEGQWSQVAFDNLKLRKYHDPEPEYYIG